MSQLIILTGRARSGKTTVSHYLRDKHDFKIVKFAGILKEMLYQLGLGEAHIEGELKEVPCELLGGKTPRYAMQTLGTEWGRGMISQTLWVDAWRREVETLLDWGYDVVTDDCRFDNELEAALELGATVIKMSRQQTECDVSAEHASENVPSLCHHHIENNDGMIALHLEVDRIVNDEI